MMYVLILFQQIFELICPRVTPSSCDDPVCDNDPVLCDGEMICRSHITRPLLSIQVLCLIIYAVELVLRLCTCTSVSAR
jgi:hypothetical protein